MAIVQGAWNKLLHPGLAKDAKEAYTKFLEEYSLLEPGTSENNINPKYVHKTYALGFTISKEVIEDDVYGRPKPVVRELHVYDLGGGMLVPCQLVDDLFGH